MKKSDLKLLIPVKFGLNGFANLLILSFGIITFGCSYTQKTCVRLLKKAEKEGPFDAIIVPGVPFDSKLWSRTMKGRVYWSYYLYKKGIAKNVIYSGSAVYSPYVEAKIMALYGEALGIAPENIFVESKAEHSTENIYYSYQLAKKNGFTKIALASDPFQSKLLQSFSKRHTPSVKMIPMVFDTLVAISKNDPVIDSKKAFVPNFISITQRESFWERLKGTQGKKIKFE